MDTLIYWFARGVVAVASGAAAGLGRAPRPRAAARWRTGSTRRHRRVALENLTMCFGSEKSPAEIRALAKENFRRIGENYCQRRQDRRDDLVSRLRPHFEFVGAGTSCRTRPTPRRQSRIVAIGHFGNFELYARFGQFVPVYQMRHDLSRPETARAQPPDGSNCANAPAAVF